MITLKESLLSKTSIKISNTRTAIDKDIVESFLKDNYECNYIISETPNKDGLYIVNVDGSVNVINKNITSLTNGLFEFGEVSKQFNCYGCKSLTTLKGAPKKVGWGFDCSHCENLDSLEDAPKSIGASFDCSHCYKLTSLKGVPRECWDFNCSYCSHLKSLKDSPKTGGSFNCDRCVNLTSLEGAPKTVDKNFYCCWCVGLKSLKGAPKKVKWDFQCTNCGFTEDDVRKVCDVEGDVIC